MRQHTIRRVQQKPRQFPSGAGERLREQRELRTADRVLILRQRSASGKTPGGPATASAKKSPPNGRRALFAFRTAKERAITCVPCHKLSRQFPKNGECNRSCAEGERSGRSSGALRSCAAVKCTLFRPDTGISRRT